MTPLEELHGKINDAKTRLDALRPLDPEREGRAMQKFRLWWTYHSNAIEGNKLTEGETEIFLLEGLTAKGKPLKDHLDLSGHSNAINFLLEFVRHQDELTEAAIRELHRILLVEEYKVEAITPDGRPTTKTVRIGAYKTLPNHVRTPTGELHYYASPEETPARMHDLMTWYRDETGNGLMHPVEIAARFHHRFTDIHPFDDGNGRMSRLLMNLMLMRVGYPPAIIRNDERDAYIAALRLADRNEYAEFNTMIGEHVLESLELFIKAANGEPISQPSDLKKEIQLEIMRLAHVEEHPLKTTDNVSSLYKDSITPLIDETVDLLSPFKELFLETKINLSSECTRGTDMVKQDDIFPLDRLSLQDHLQTCFSGGFSIASTTIVFMMSDFRKAHFNAFGLDAAYMVVCAPLHYSVRYQMQEIKHFYQEKLTKEEIRNSAEAVAANFLKVIQENTKSTLKYSEFPND